jgi:GDPmannose 4,6-dehydratase
VDSASGRVIVKIDPRYFRPTEVDTLLGDPSKARAKLGWQPQYSFADLVREMVAEDLDIARRDAVVAREGFKTYRHHE